VLPKDLSGKAWKRMLRLRCFCSICEYIGFALFHKTKICCCCNISYSNRTVLRVIVCLELVFCWQTLACTLVYCTVCSFFVLPCRLFVIFILFFAKHNFDSLQLKRHPLLHCAFWGWSKWKEGCVCLDWFQI